MPIPVIAIAADYGKRIALPTLTPMEGCDTFEVQIRPPGGSVVTHALSGLDLVDPDTGEFSFVLSADDIATAGDYQIRVRGTKADEIQATSRWAKFRVLEG